MPSVDHVRSVLTSLSNEHLNTNLTDDVTESDDDVTAWREATFPDLSTKYIFLTSCISEFKRDIPSSQLSYLLSVYDVYRFYTTPVQRPRYLEIRPQSLPFNVKIVMESIDKPLETV